MYILINPTHTNAGMFSYIWETLRGIHQFPDKKYFVQHGKQSCYYDRELEETQGIGNVWEYYFEQPHTNAYPLASDIEAVVRMSQDDASEYRDVYLTSQDYIRKREEYNHIIQQHVRLLPHISEKVDAFYDENFKGKLVVGLHCRGTDHPDSQPIEAYIGEIDEVLKDFDYLFVTSDEQQRVDFLKQRYGEKIILYNASIRSSSSTPLHYGNSAVNSPYYVGEDVIVEAYLLSKTNKLLCCTGSNVNFYVRALNTTLPYVILTGSR